MTVGIVTFGAKADEWDKKTVLTVSEPIQVRETLLEPGQYVFKLLNSPSDRHIVQIFNRDETHIINTVLAIPKERTQATGKSQFTFWETPPGTARALRAWFYPGDTIGQEFPYPKHLNEIAMAAPPSAAPAPAPPPPAAEPTPPASTTQPESMTEQPPAQEPAPPSQPVESAQSTPPLQPAAPPPSNPPEELPKTASPYPLIGLSGLFLLGLSALVKLTRIV
jgi:hypothetical protein